MTVRMTEFPKHPVPGFPQPEQPHRAQTRQPMVYVYEKQEWEYKVIGRNLTEQPALSEDELNDLGASGWELVGVVALSPASVQFYFKRARA